MSTPLLSQIVALLIWHNGPTLSAVVAGVDEVAMATMEQTMPFMLSAIYRPGRLTLCHKTDTDEPNRQGRRIFLGTGPLLRDIAAV